MKNATVKTVDWKTQSVLNTGKWIKIRTSGKGIYKIPYSKLSEWGFSNPSQVNVFGSGGLQLSEKTEEITYDDLEQNAVWTDENGGENCLFFYEPGNIQWLVNDDGKYFVHKNHDYSNQGFFFLTEDVGLTKTPQMTDEITESPTFSMDDFDDYLLYEKNGLNLISSGKQWFGEKFSQNQTHSFNFSLSDVNNSKNAQLKINAAARSYQSSKLRVTANSVHLGEIDFTPVNTDDQVDIYARQNNKKILFEPDTDNENLKIDLTFAGSNTNAVAWLDYIEVNFRRDLNINGGSLFFRDLKAVGPGNIVDFEIQSASSALRVFDVTDVNNVLEIPVDANGNQHTIRRPADGLKEYVAFDPNGDFAEPELAGDVENQDLHGLPTPEYLIITHPLFLNSANELAQFHESHDGLSTEVVVSTAIYNEFSSGHFDATAIRNFIKMFYDRGNTLKYVLLFGDGSFDNKNVHSNDLNFIPTYQSQNSLNPVASFITDDYYALLDEGESVYNGAVDLGIGRIPASTQYQAQLVVDKDKKLPFAANVGKLAKCNLFYWRR